jgi:hypothetical protein
MRTANSPYNIPCIQRAQSRKCCPTLASDNLQTQCVPHCQHKPFGERYMYNTSYGLHRRWRMLQLVVSEYLQSTVGWQNLQSSTKYQIKFTEADATCVTQPLIKLMQFYQHPRLHVCSLFQQYSIYS